MKIIPVIDLLGGQVVRGVAGRRAEYQPVRSRLVEGSDPAAVAGAFFAIGFRSVYVADLDAIGGGPADVESYRRIRACGLELLIDGGFSRPEPITQLLEAGSEFGAIVGLETLANPAALRSIAQCAPTSRITFSLDLVRGEPKTLGEDWQGMPAVEIGELAYECGFRDLIVLDIAQVGTGQGVATAELCRRLRESLGDDVRLISGGGVRGAADLERLAECGCDAALVASALHDGSFAAEQLRAYL